MSKGNNFIERSIMGALSFLKEAVFADEYAMRKGFLQSIDPRIKTVSFFLLLIQILFTQDILVLCCLYAACLLLAYCSRIGLGFFLKRTWIFIPLFSLFIAIPAVFSFFTPGEVLFSFDAAGWRLAVTRQGVDGAVLFVTRVVTSVSFAVLLSLTTKNFELLKVLRVLGIPQIFVMTLGMCYRYIFLFMGTIENTYMAVKSRVGTSVHYKKGQHIVAWNIASLWQRSYRFNEEVYNAMLSRGYSGEPVILNDFKTRARDWAWLCFAAGVFVLLWYLRRKAGV